MTSLDSPLALALAQRTFEAKYCLNAAFDTSLLQMDDILIHFYMSRFGKTNAQLFPIEIADFLGRPRSKDSSTGIPT